MVFNYFVGVYALGVAVLVYDGFSFGLRDLTIANLVSLVVVGAVFVKIFVGGMWGLLGGH